jgi:excisionase family DNA binding protein
MKQFYGREELADLLRVSARTIDRLRKAREIQGFTIGGRRLYAAAEVDALVAALMARKEKEHDAERR